MVVFVKRIKVFPLGCMLARGDIPRRHVSTVVCPFPFGCMLARGDILGLCKRGILISSENESVSERYGSNGVVLLRIHGRCRWNWFCSKGMCESEPS